MAHVPAKTACTAVGYIRMSSDLQEKSPHQQREHILKLAAKLGCRIVRWYQDLGVSGDNIKRRTDFRQMVADATAKRDFKLILCWSQDRFGRFDALDAGEWVAPLRRAGVRLVTVAEGEINWTDTAGRLIYTIQQEGKNTFLLDMARTSTRGRCQAAARVGFFGGPVPYGYDRLVYDERGVLLRRLDRSERFRKPREWHTVLVKSEDAAAVRTVRWIFRTYHRGLSIDAIVVKLNDRGIPSPRDKYWSRMTVRNMLRNPVYAGDQVWNRRHSGKYFAVLNGEVASEAGRRQRRGERVTELCHNPEEDWIVVRDAHPALISRQVFDRVQARLQQRLGRAYQQPGLPLTGLVRCGHCGVMMGYQSYQQTYKARKYQWRKIICMGNRQGTSVCKSRMISEPMLLSFVVETLASRVISDGFEERMRKQLQKDFAPKVRTQAECIALHAKITRLDRTIERGMENLLLADPRSVDGAAAKLAQWQADRDMATADLSAVDEVTPKKINAIIADTMSEVWRLRFGLENSDRAILHHTLQRLVKMVTLWFEPNPEKRGCSRFARGTMVALVPYQGGKAMEQVIHFDRDAIEELGRRSPYWHARLHPKKDVEPNSPTPIRQFGDDWPAGSLVQRREKLVPAALS